MKPADENEKRFREIGEALHKITEQMIAYEQAMASLAHGLTAVKGLLADQISPGNVAEGLERIQLVQNAIAKRDPQAKARAEAADLAEAVRLMEKHGGPKQS